MAPKGGKSARTRERKEKNVVDIDHRFVEQPRGGGRGRGRGDFRGSDRGRGGRGRGDYRGRGEFRGARGGGRGADNPLPIEDTNAFPSLS